MKLFKNLLKLVLLLIPVVIIYSVFVEPKLLTVQHYQLVSAKQAQMNVKIVQFTDTQLGQFYSLSQLKTVVTKINAEKPDIIFFTGDLIDSVRKYHDTNKVVGVLAQLHAVQGKFAIYGNHDYGGGAERYYADIMKKSGFDLLVNEKAIIKLADGRHIAILGLDDVMLGDPQPQILMREINRNDYNILLLHEPDYIDKFNGSDIRLAFAGHSHGGQIRLPFVGAIVRAPYSVKYNKGFYQVNDGRTTLYVNSGLGNTRLPFRLMNLPEIAVFNLKL